jgi:hypothetical protein
MESTTRGYQALGQEDSKQSLDKKSSARPGVRVTIVAIMALVLLGLAAYFYQSTIFYRKIKWTDCGQSPAEARKRGCHFDVMAGSWMPSHCYNASLAEEYIEAGQYTWSLDHDGEYPVSLEIVRQGDHEEVWTSAEFHRQHCVYMWRKLVYDIATTKWVDDGESGIGHIAHCADLLTDSNWLDRGNKSIVPTAYPSCTFLGAGY